MVSHGGVGLGQPVNSCAASLRQGPKFEHPEAVDMQRIACHWRRSDPMPTNVDITLASPQQ